MNAVLATLKLRNVEPRLVRGKLRLVGSRGQITPELIALVRAHAAELKAALPETVDLNEREENEIDHLAATDGWEPPKEIPASVAREITRIEPVALALGWSRERLWNFRFWPHTTEQPRGLASVLHPGDQIAEVRVDHIVILHRRYDVLRFQRFDA